MLDLTKKIIDLTKFHKLYFQLTNLIFSKINKYSFQGARLSYGATVYRYTNSLGPSKCWMLANWSARFLKVSVVLDPSIRAGSDYDQTLRGEAFGPMDMQKCPKSVLSAFTLKAEVQRRSPPKEPRWQHFQEVMAPRDRPLEQSLAQAKCSTQISVERPNCFFIQIFKM